MEFAELKKKILDELELERPEWVKDTDDSVCIGYLELGATQKLIFSLSNYRGKQYVDVRTWYQDQAGEWKPTKKGIHFNIDKFEDFDKVMKLYSDIQAMPK